MRIFIATIILVLVSLQADAQNSFADMPEIQVKENKDYSYYIGTWMWEDTTSRSEFIVKLEMAQATSTISDKSFPYIKGGYRYVKNSSIIIDCMSDILEERDFILYPIFIFADNDNNMQLNVRDYHIKNGNGRPKLHAGSSFIKYISAEPEQILWKIVDNRQSGHIYVDPNMIDPSGITLPDNIVLKKIE